MRHLLLLVAALLWTVTTVQADDPAADLDRPGVTPELPPQQDRGASRLPANNPEGPLVIPHRTRGHQVDLRHNRCMDCHGDQAPEEIQATPLPSSHLRDRDGEKHEGMSGGRQDCRTCHVPDHRTGQEAWGGH